ncbi:hypothetical protein Tco_1336763 [Tanacetum coccineum]
MDDLNITIEEYIRLEEGKACRRGKVFNWETAKYGKIWYDEDIYDLRSVETEFPTIVFDDAFTSEVTHSCEPMIQRISLIGFPAQSVGSSNTDVLDSLCLLVLITGMSQSRQHGKSESDSYYLSD